MIKVVSWNIAKREKPWRELVEMDADVALVQEAGSPPGDLIDLVDYEDGVFWDRHLYDRWPLVLKLSDRVEVEWFKQVAPICDLGSDAIGVSGIGTIAAAKVVPVACHDKAFIAVSMYARWLRPHPSVKTNWSVGYSDASAHRIISDLSAFIGSRDPSTHRILAAGDLNMIYGAIGYKLSLPERERTVWDRFQALGLEFIGPQWPDACRQASSQPTDVPGDTKNVPTFYSLGGSPETALNQLDYAFASRGFHESVKVRALNEIDNDKWGSSDHCRLLIEVDCG
ncbi:MAG: hypothetical protein OXH81_19395 [Gemmatimonadetes bacterium]|nr:hypothetical protein [Gemmatimonadota bacterium]